MREVRGTETCARWLDGLRDVRARVRVERLVAVNPGEVSPVDEGVSEMRIDYGPDYRGYFKRQGQTIVVLLAGGDKRTQGADIETALRLACDLELDTVTKTVTAPYDVAVHLRTREDMAAYLEASIEEADGDAAVVARALGDIARARGLAQVASDAELSRGSLLRSPARVFPRSRRFSGWSARWG